MPVRPSSRHSCGLLGSVEPDEIQPQLSQPWLLQCWWRTVIGEGGHGGFAEGLDRLSVLTVVPPARSELKWDKHRALAFALSADFPKSLGYRIGLRKSSVTATIATDDVHAGQGPGHSSKSYWMELVDKIPDNPKRVVFERAHNRGSRFHYVKTRGCHLHWVETSTPDPRKRGAQGDSRTSIRRKAARINSPTTHEYLLTGVDIEVGQFVPQAENKEL
ncbi:uncharacterized protein [Miscanthus floridulus]|uniref:uncharacterized protein isoform X2 n=1 Tax=Miscanthus floridulus TaxID=154761 RepID=UPI0034586965